MNKSKHELDCHPAMITPQVALSHMSTPGRRAHSPWLAVAGVFGVYFSFGFAIGSMGPLVDEISVDLGLSRSAMGSILGAWALVYVFTAVPAGAAVDRLGLRWSMLLGGLSIGLSLLLRSIATGGWSLFAGVAVFGIGGPLVSIATPKLVASLFQEDARRLPTGIGVSAPALGSGVALAATNPVLLPLVGGTWRGVMLIGAGIAFLMTLGWLYASRAVAHVRPQSATADRSSVRRLLGLRSIRSILLVSLLSFFFSHAFNSWLPEVLADAGRSDNAAGYLAALSTIVGILGSLVIARAVPSRVRSRVLSAIFIVLGALVALLGTLPVGPLIAALAVLGFARAGVIPLLFLEIMGDPDIELGDVGAATGLFFAVGEIGGFAGPFAFGATADATGSFTSSLLLLSAVALAAAAASATLTRSSEPAATAEH